jgi:RNA-directed DNA polymerase
MMARKAAARYLARAARAGELGLEGVEGRLQEAVGEKRLWVRRVAKAIVREFGGKRPSSAALAKLIERQVAFLAAFNRGKIPVDYNFGSSGRMSPAEGAPKSWGVPAITTVKELATRLNVSFSELEWVADLHGLERTAGTKLQHYFRNWKQKRDVSFRLIESPKQLLKLTQRRILREILEKIPVHDAAHGFQKGRSILSFAGPHAGRGIVLRLDLKDFFPTFSFARVLNLFLTAGYPENVAKYLAGICTTVCAHGKIMELPKEQRRAARLLYVRKHLAQGAPTSPMLGNLCAFNLDCRLSGLARAAGAVYTRYADDLVFSGDAEFARGVNRFLIHAMAIAMEEGFEVHARKTKVMRQGVAQRAAGLTLNAKVNVRRDEFDRLKAILTNCARNGAEKENREGLANFRAHLEGRISFVAMVNRVRGEKLRGIFRRIQW